MVEIKAFEHCAKLKCENCENVYFQETTKEGDFLSDVSCPNCNYPDFEEIE